MMRTNLSRAALAAATALLLSPLTAAAATTEEKVDRLTKEVEQLKKEVKKRTSHGASEGETKFEVYGELHYNNLDSGDEIDFHRLIFEVEHEFSETIEAVVEVELEHSVAGDNQNGEIEVEQAYVDFDLNQQHTARGGLFLLPVGILNQHHEPTEFYGVERNPVETNIVPTSWWECGAAIYGELAPGFSYDVAAHSGLMTSAANNYQVRNGRQKCSEAPANDLAYTTRLSWTGISGVEVAGSVQLQKDVTQGADPTAGDARLYEVHTRIERGPFGFRALYAVWDLDGAGPKAIGADEQEGFYVEPSFKITPKLGVFARYNEWDNSAGTSPDTKVKQTDVGVNYWPHEHVVLKADVQAQKGAADDDGFNLGLGFVF